MTGTSGEGLNFEAQHSVAQTLGETDLELWFSDAEGTRWAVLIENIIDADSQEKQPERYRLRAENYVQSKAAGQARTVLFAPPDTRDRDALWTKGADCLSVQFRESVF